jgi:hypothetical protein
MRTALPFGIGRPALLASTTIATDTADVVSAADAFTISVAEAESDADETMTVCESWSACSVEDVDVPAASGLAAIAEGAADVGDVAEGATILGGAFAEVSAVTGACVTVSGAGDRASASMR